MRPIDRIKLEFDFDRLLASDGYYFNPKRSVRGSGGYQYKIFQKLDSNKKPIETLQRGWGPQGHQVYLNLNDSSDRGSVIDYLQKRHSLNYKEIFSFVENFDASIAISQIDIAQSQKKKSKIIYQILETEPVTKSRILLERNIHDLIQHPHFKSSMSVCTVKAIYDNRKDSKIFQALGFPLTDANNIRQAYTLKGLSFKTLFTGPRRSCLWLSHITDGPVMFVESAIDALSHYKLYPNNYTYVSSEGRFSTSFIATLKSLIPDLHNRSLIFGNDNDLDGHLYDLQWLIHIYDLDITAAKHVITDKYDYSLKDKYLIIKTSSFELINRLEIQYGDTQYCNGHQKYLREEVFRSAFKTICNYFDLSRCIQIKSSLKDFNEDLKHTTINQNSY